MVLSSQASNAILYLSYGAMLVSGLAVAFWHMRKTSRDDGFLSSNRSSTGIPLALNFIASGMYSTSSVYQIRTIQVFHQRFFPTIST